jgi:hypothetical protein
MPGLVTVMGDGRDSRIKDPKDWVRYNGAPSQDFWITRRHPESGEYQSERSAPAPQATQTVECHD